MTETKPKAARRKSARQSQSNNTDPNAAATATGQAEPSREAEASLNPAKTDDKDVEVEIRCVAHELYLSRGGRDGDDLLDWLEAERLVRFRRGPAFGQAPEAR